MMLMYPLRAMLHDETVYPNPDIFSPDRFLDESGRLDRSITHPDTACFGFGRRYDFMYVYVRESRAHSISTSH